jgi:hypothetical protein
MMLYSGCRVLLCGLVVLRLSLLYFGLLRLLVLVQLWIPVQLRMLVLRRILVRLQLTWVVCLTWRVCQRISRCTILLLLPRSRLVKMHHCLSQMRSLLSLCLVA